MDLGSILSRVSGKTGGGSAQPETFVALKISSSNFLATTWHVENGKVLVGQLGIGELNGTDPQAMLSAADKAISLALGDQGAAAQKVIFGLTPDWISEGKIVDEKLKMLRHLCKEMDLSPLGFVPISEAIENFLKEAEGAPLTAVLIGVDKEKGWVTLYRAGKNLGTVAIDPEDIFSGEICAGIEKSLKKFSHIDVLPARMIIYDGLKELDVLEAKITAFPWTKQLPFLHFPKVEIMPGQSVVKAVAIAGGTQMGGKIEEAEELITETVAPSPQAEAEKAALESPEQMEPELEEVSAQEAGFVSGGSFGQLQEFVVNRPSAQTASVKSSVPGAKFQNQMMEKIKKVFQNIKLPEKPGFRVNTPKIGGNMPVKSLPMIGLVVGVVIAIAALIIYLVPVEAVTIHVAAKTFDHEMEINASEQVVEVTEIGTKKGSASGKKLVGDKAKGSVTIANPSDARSFAAGTVITSASGLKFVLASDVQLASGSGVLAMSSTTAQVTASEIGDNYNLPAGTLFSIGSFAGQAKNDSAFTGGNSHQATVVTKGDQDRLLATLSAELSQKAQTDLVAKLNPGQKLLPNAITQAIQSKKFSKDIDAEAETVSLDMTMTFKGVVATQSDIVNKFLEKYPGEVPSGYQIVDDQTNVDIKGTKTDKAGNVVMTVHLAAKFLPQTDSGEIVKNISGKSQSYSADYIGKLTGVTGVDFETKPTFFQGITKLALPWRKGAIKLEVVSD